MYLPKMWQIMLYGSLTCSYWYLLSSKWLLASNNKKDRAVLCTAVTYIKQFFIVLHTALCRMQSLRHGQKLLKGKVKFSLMF